MGAAVWCGVVRGGEVGLGWHVQLKTRTHHRGVVGRKGREEVEDRPRVGERGERCNQVTSLSAHISHTHRFEGA